MSYSQMVRRDSFVRRHDSFVRRHGSFVRRHVVSWVSMTCLVREYDTVTLTKKSCLISNEKCHVTKIDMTHSCVVSRTSHVWSRMSHVMRQPTQHTATHCNTLHQHRPKEMRMRHPPESWFGIACVADVAIRNATICCCCHLQRNYVLLIANIICYQQPIVHLLPIFSGSFVENDVQLRGSNQSSDSKCIAASAMHYLLLRYVRQHICNALFAADSKCVADVLPYISSHIRHHIMYKTSYVDMSSWHTWNLYA